MKKTFILDTNVILSSGTGGGSRVLNGFLEGKDANDIVIPGTVLQELDHHKTDPGETGFNARDFIRVLDGLRESSAKGSKKSDLVRGVKLKRGHIFVEPDGVKAENLPVGFDLKVPDNRIISFLFHIAVNRNSNNTAFLNCRCVSICF